jgi:hypothetical protein
MREVARVRASFGVKLMRAGFGPPAELPYFIASVTASRRLP